MKQMMKLLLVTIGSIGILKGMDRVGPSRPNYAAHSYYFYYAVGALERRDRARVELYCKLDPKLVSEIETAIAQNTEQANWAMGVLGDIKAQARL